MRAVGGGMVFLNCNDPSFLQSAAVLLAAAMCHAM